MTVLSTQTSEAITTRLNARRRGYKQRFITAIKIG